MSPFPRPDYASLRRYDPERAPVRLDLSDNTNLWGTHPAALERVRAATTDDLARYPTLYADPLRDAVAERFGVDPECVTTGAGSDDVLDSAFRASFGPGARMSYAAPTFSMVEPFARMNGMVAMPVSWPEAEDDPHRLLSGKPDLVYVCRPNNPTGGQAARSWLDALLAARGDDGPLVVVDEAYADFAGETLLPEAPSIPGLLVARTASKAYGLAGLRCGYAVGAPDVAVEIEKSRGPYKVARLAAEAAAAAVRDEGGWMAGVIAETVVNRGRLTEALTARGRAPLLSRANFVLMPAPTGSARADALALRAEGVGVRPFTGIPEMGEGLRVTVAPWSMMDEFLHILDATFCAGDHRIDRGHQGGPA
jgi:histidinol-phosphate aminotransferase